MYFQNRLEAGKLLATHLTYHEFNAPIVIALARGGVPIAYEVAKTLKIPMDVLVVRKIGAPGNPEYGIGAVTENDFFYINSTSAASTGTTPADLDLMIRIEKAEVTRRTRRYRGDRPRISVQGQTVILVDDGLATGVSAKTAFMYLKEQGAREIVIAVPVCSASGGQYFRDQHATVICLEESDLFFSVGQFYNDFNQVTDDEVIGLLKKARAFNSLETATGLSGFSIAIQIPLYKPDYKPDLNQTIPRSTHAATHLEGILTIPPSCQGIVIFAHGSGSSRKSPRNLQVASALNQAGLGTLLFDLLTPAESLDRKNVFDIPLLAARLKLATHFLHFQIPDLIVPIGYFGASTGAAAALWAAADLGNQISAIVSRGGRPDLATTRLPDVKAPTLLLVGSLDEAVIEMNREVVPLMPHSDLVIVPGATHLFEEPGTLENVATLAEEWFKEYFKQEKLKIDLNQKKLKTAPGKKAA